VHDSRVKKGERENTGRLHEKGKSLKEGAKCLKPFPKGKEVWRGTH